MDVATTTQEWIRQGNSSGPAWSPDGAVILFSDGNQLHTIAPDGTGLRQLSSGPGQHLSGSWSRDGRTIAFDYFAQQPGSSQQIYLMNADGSGSRNITNASATATRRPSDHPADPGGRLSVTPKEEQLSRSGPAFGPRQAATDVVAHHS
jgi:Tol biopolymer transport system component